MASESESCKEQVELRALQEKNIYLKSMVMSLTLVTFDYNIRVHRGRFSLEARNCFDQEVRPRLDALKPALSKFHAFLSTTPTGDK